MRRSNSSSSIVAPSTSQRPDSSNGKGGVFLRSDEIAGAFSVTMMNGKPGRQGSAFLDRLLPPTRVVMTRKDSQVSLQRVASTLRTAVGVVGTPQMPVRSPMMASFVGVDSFRASSAPIDEDDDRDSNRSSTTCRSAGGLTASFRLTDGSTTTAAAAGASGDSWFDEFFRKMHTDLRELRRVDVAAFAAQEEKERALRARQVSSSASLHPLVQVDAAKRKQVNAMFSNLQRPETRDTERAHERRHLLHREHRYHQHIGLIVDPARTLLEALWDQHRVPHRDRARFQERFNSTDLETFDAISKELKRYCNIPPTELELIRLVAWRETHVERLREAVKKESLLVTTDATVAEGLVLNIFNCIMLLRHITHVIVDGVMHLRETEGLIRASPLQWNGMNYLLHMQHDLDFLATSKLARMLGPTFPLIGNPLLLPPHLHDACKKFERDLSESRRSTTTLRDIMRLEHDAARSVTPLFHIAGGPSAAVAAEGSHGVRPESQQRTASRSGVGTSVGTDGAGGAGASKTAVIVARDGEEIVYPNAKYSGGTGDGAPLTTTTRTSTTSSSNGSATGRHHNSAGNANERANSATPALAEVSSFRGARHRLRNVSSLSAAGVSRDGNSVAQALDAAAATNSSVPMSREAYFAKLRKAELMKRRVCSEPRVNVYQYPASVYQEKPLPLWTRLSQLLLVSLDPRVVGERFVDDCDLEARQFGRLSAPPVLSTVMSDAISDRTHGCLRSNLDRDLPDRTYHELMIREIWIFAEDSFLRYRGSQKKFHRALGRLKMAYRGFVAALHHRRAVMQAHEAGPEFVAWVRQYAPHWIEDAQAVLQSDDDDVMLNAVEEFDDA